MSLSTFCFLIDDPLGNRVSKVIGPFMMVVSSANVPKKAAMFANGLSPCQATSRVLEETGFAFRSNSSVQDMTRLVVPVNAHNPGLKLMPLPETETVASG